KAVRVRLPPSAPVLVVKAGVPRERLLAEPARRPRRRGHRQGNSASKGGRRRSRSSPPAAQCRTRGGLRLRQSAIRRLPIAAAMPLRGVQHVSFYPPGEDCKPTPNCRTGLLSQEYL